MNWGSEVRATMSFPGKTFGKTLMKIPVNPTLRKGDFRLMPPFFPGETGVGSLGIFFS